MPSRPSHGQSASSRERLLRSAKRLFAAQGYEQTATSAIAREAGTSESQLMRYFGGKVGLLEALFDEAWIDLNARVKRVIGRSADSRETILDVVETIASALARDSALATLFLFEGRRLRGEKPRVRVAAGFVAFAEIAKGLVRKGQASNELDPLLDVNAMTSAILGAAEAMIRERVLARTGGYRPFAEREIRRTLDAMLSGFAGKARARPKKRAVATGKTATRGM